MMDVKVGDTVIVGGHRGNRHTVTKVGRVWFSVSQIRQPFAIETGRMKGWDTCAYTLDEWAARERAMADGRYLKEQGITINRESPWFGRTGELANLIRTHEERKASLAAQIQDDIENR